jgi:ABC-type uncharacterized transport system fused permease/ATPase subunit
MLPIRGDTSEWKVSRASMLIRGHRLLAVFLDPRANDTTGSGRYRLSAAKPPLEWAALGDFVESLPERLAMRVAGRGVQLSGEQRQRIAIARAFLKDAPILILDEAASHLDTISEQQIRAASQTADVRQPWPEKGVVAACDRDGAGAA